MSGMNIPQDFSIRQAGNQDVDAVIKLISTALGEYGLPLLLQANDSDLYDLEAHYSKNGGLFQVLLDKSGGIIGSVALRRMSDEICELCRM